MSQKQSSYKVIAEGPISIGNALVRKDDIVQLTPAVARHYASSLKLVKTPVKKPTDVDDKKTAPKLTERKTK